MKITCNSQNGDCSIGSINCKRVVSRLSRTKVIRVRFRAAYYGHMHTAQGHRGGLNFVLSHG